MIWVRSDGSVAYVQNDVAPLFDTHGQVYGCVSVCVDLTDRKLAEIALREADRRKDEFLATLSHELRNPLNAMLGWASVLKRKNVTPAMLDGETGQLVTARGLPWYLRALQVSRPLHFGDYGGLPLKIIWALLDFAAIVLLASGVYLWLGKRKSPSTQQVSDRPAVAAGSGIGL